MIFFSLLNSTLHVSNFYLIFCASFGVFLFVYFLWCFIFGLLWSSILLFSSSEDEIDEDEEDIDADYEDSEYESTESELDEGCSNIKLTVPLNPHHHQRKKRCPHNKKVISSTEQDSESSDEDSDTEDSESDSGKSKFFLFF